MGVTTVDQAGLAFTARWEGGQSADGLYRAYWDAYGRVWTIGCGWTHGVTPGMVWTRAQAYANLAGRMGAFIAPLLATGYDFSQNALNGFADAAWNLGPGIASWDVGRCLRAGNLQAAADALLAYDRAGGVVLAGLASRRHAEHDLILTPDPKPAPAPDAHGYLKFDTTDRDLGHGRHGNERQLVQEYDVERAHWLRWPRRLRVLRDDLDFLAARLTNLIHDDPANNGPNNRQWRRDQLAGRAAGKRYV